MAKAIDGAAPMTGEQPKPKVARQRSPAYPALNLETAIQRTRSFYDYERRNPANLMVAFGHWGFKTTSGGGMVTIAALKYFGLMKDSGTGDKRTVQLTELGARIVIDQRPVSPERDQAIKEAALLPKLHALLWRKYGTNLPSDANLRHELVFDQKFNENSVGDFIQEYRDTIRFAKLTDSDTLSVELKDKDLTEETPDQAENYAPQVGEFVQWESQGVLQLPEPRRLRAISEDGEWAFLEGSTTGVSVKELTAVDASAVEKRVEQQPPRPEFQKAKERPGLISLPPTMRSYAWALSGDFTAKLDLFGEARTDEDIDALSDYVEATIKALKRSLKAKQAGEIK